MSFDWNYSETKRIYIPYLPHSHLNFLSESHSNGEKYKIKPIKNLSNEGHKNEKYSFLYEFKN